MIQLVGGWVGNGGAGEGGVEGSVRRPGLLDESNAHSHRLQSALTGVILPSRTNSRYQ